MPFEISKTHEASKARAGVLTCVHGRIETPFFMPIATRGVVKGLDVEKLKELQAQIVLGNTYHLLLSPGPEFLRTVNGLHNFMKWEGPMLTDSGGYQVFSLAKFRKLNEQGVTFKSLVDGRKYELTPEFSIEIQHAIGSDFMMVLDECPPYPSTEAYVKKSLDLTTRWAKRCMQYHLKHQDKEQYLFAIVQGGIYPELRKESASQLVPLGFDGYAIGGVAVGEPREYLKDVLEATIPELPEEKPRYLMGLGRPEELVYAVKSGVDMFDCVIPTREGRHGRLFYWTGDFDFNSDDASFYETQNLRNAKFRDDHTPIDPDSELVLLRLYTKSYLHYLFKIGDTLAMQLATLHNLSFYLKLMKKMREAIHTS